MADMQLGQAGVRFTILITDEGGSAIPISSATTKNLVLKGPSGARVERAADFYTDGSDGKITYVTVAEDTVEAGNWQGQAEITLPGGLDGMSSIFDFEVINNL